MIDRTARVGLRGDATTALEVRVRMVGFLARPASSVSKMSRERVRKMQRRGLLHNRVAAVVCGASAPEVALNGQTIDGPGGALPVRVYRPETESSAQIVRGSTVGAGALGNLDQSDWLCSHVSAATGAVVVSVDYRLAPLNPLPAAVEDAYAALSCAADELAADGRRIGVMGDSAGGNLAAVVALMARDRSGPQMSDQALIYPNTDRTLSGASMRTNANKPFLSGGRRRCLPRPLPRRPAECRSRPVRLAAARRGPQRAASGPDSGSRARSDPRRRNSIRQRSSYCRRARSAHRVCRHAAHLPQRPRGFPVSAAGVRRDLCRAVLSLGSQVKTVGA